MKEVLKCSFCDCELHASEPHTFDGKVMCYSCFESRTVVCRICGRTLWREDAVDGNLCERCYEQNYTTCSECGVEMFYEDAFYVDGDYDHDDPLCSECYHGREDNRIIHDYYYKPEPIFFGNARRYYGIELEIDEGGECEGCANKILSIANSNGEHLYAKHDGSLNDGFELVSHPMTFKYHKNEMPWQDIMNKSIELGYLSHQARTCGLHVHINRRGLGATYEQQEETIAKIVFFYEKFWSEILRFSRRTEAQANRWARRYGGGLINPKETLKHAKGSCLGRYVAVNLENANTVEMRIFRGTLKYSTFIATLQMVDEICDVAVSLSDEELQNLGWLDFVQRITSDKQELIDYLKLRLLYVNEPVKTEEDF
ncbi:MAG: zinc-binding protein [Clostridia bacterium]|nr:zinc-binding protein [Clostridia bacterium]